MVKQCFAKVEVVETLTKVKHVGSVLGGAKHIIASSLRCRESRLPGLHDAAVNAMA